MVKYCKGCDADVERNAQGRCPVCKDAASKRWLAKNLDIAKIGTNIKYCKKCRRDQERNTEGRCKVCKNAITKAWELRNPEKVKAGRRAQYVKKRIEKPELIKEQSRAYYVENTDKIRLLNSKKYALKTGHTPVNLDLEGLKRFMAWSSTICPLCSLNPASHLDHCHVTGEPLGIICGSCNSGAGRVDSIEWLEARIAYLKDPPYRRFLLDMQQCAAE